MAYTYSAKEDYIPVNCKIDRFSPQPGQWVAFYDMDSPTYYMPDLWLDGPFKVLSRDDRMFEICGCMFMNLKGKTISYTPRMGLLGDRFIGADFSIWRVNPETIEKDNPGRMDFLRGKSLEHLKDLFQDTDVWGRGFNPDDETTTLSGQQIREKYGLSGARHDPAR